MARFSDLSDGKSICGSGPFRHTIRASTAVLAVSLLTPQPGMAQSWSLYNNYTTSYTIPYMTPFDTALVNNGSLDLHISLNGSTPQRFTMDTGSTGVAVASTLIPNFTTSGTQGWVFYNSSGLLLQGYFNNVTLSFPDATDPSGAPATVTETIPVLGVTNMTCLPGFPNPCSTSTQPKMFGVGVDRNTMGIGVPSQNPSVLNAAPAISQAYNPLVNLDANQSALFHSGFIITPQGVQLGLTAQNTTNFAYQMLAPLSGAAGQAVQSIGNWQQAGMSVSVNGGTSVPGTILMDTGVNDAFLYIRGQPISGSLAAGSVVSLQLLNAGQNVTYSFTVGDGGPQTPVNVNWVGLDGAASFLNSTLKTYAGFNYLYDPVSGLIGLAVNNAFSGTDAAVTPVLAASGTLSLTQPFTSSIPTFLVDAATVSTTSTALFSAPMTGAGSLTVDGAGTVTLAGSNTYSGATKINPGATLALAGTGSIAASTGVVANGALDISGTTAGASINALSGSGGVALGNQALTLNGTASFAGVIADGGLNGGSGGTLTVATGTQTLSGVSTYTGLTTINPGATLALAGTGSIAASSGVAANGTLDITGTTAGASVAGLSGTGSVALGTQSLTLARANGTFAGSIGGTGGLAITGGAQALTGVNTYTGGTQISGGATLAVASDSGLGAPTGGLAFNNGTLQALASFSSARAITVATGGGTINTDSYTVTLTGPISGNDSLTMAGNVITTGTVQVGGVHIITGGTTSVNGALTAQALYVSPTGTLRGTGNVGSPMYIDGTVAPGNSPGTLHVSAPVVLAAGSVAHFDIDGTGTGTGAGTGAGNYSRMVVTGAGNSVTLGGQIDPQLRGITGSATNTYTPPLGQTFQIISAEGGVQGGFAGLRQPNGLAVGTRFDALYGANAVSLVVTPANYGNLGLAGLAQSANQAAVGAALQAVRPAAGTTMTMAQDSVFVPLYSLSGSTLGPALDQIAPTIYGDAMMAQRQSWYLFGSAINDQIDARRGMHSNASAQTVADGAGRTYWMTGLGQFASVPSAGTSGYNTTAGGVAVGMDMALDVQGLVGVAAGFGNQTITASNAASYNGNTYQFAAYGSWRNGGAFLDAQAGGGFADGTALRPQSYYGTIANGGTSGVQGGGSLRGGMQLDGGPWRLEPSLMLAGVSVGQNSLTETQGGPMGLAVGNASTASLQSLLAAQAERRIPLNDRMAVVPAAQLGWQHEFLNVSARTSAALQALPGAAFSVLSAPVGRDAAVIGLRAALESDTPVTLYAAYTGTFSGQSTAQIVTAGLRVTW